MAIYNVVPEQTVSLPFRLDARGSVIMTSDPTKIWADRVLSAVGTLKGERLFNPSYGSEIPHHTMDPIRSVEDLIYQDVSQIFTTQFPTLKFNDVITKLDTQTNTLDIEILYQLPNEDNVTSRIGFATITGAGPAVETGI